MEKEGREEEEEAAAALGCTFDKRKFKKKERTKDVMNEMGEFGVGCSLVA